MQNKTISKFAAIALLAVSAYGATSIARADGGTPVETTDGRVTPLVSDRIVVYTNADYVDVYGLDSSSQGVFLARFTKAELIAGSATRTSDQGIVTLSRNLALKFVTGYTSEGSGILVTENANSAKYTVTWSGGNYGATGVGNFAKTFEGGWQ